MPTLPPNFKRFFSCSEAGCFQNIMKIHT